MPVVCAVYRWDTARAALAQVFIKVAGEAGIEGTTAGLRGVWEATSFQLERLQCNPACVEQEARLPTYRRRR